jgi:hypothetical protein
MSVSNSANKSRSGPAHSRKRGSLADAATASISFSATAFARWRGFYIRLGVLASERRAFRSGRASRYLVRLPGPDIQRGTGQSRGGGAALAGIIRRRRGSGFMPWQERRRPLWRRGCPREVVVLCASQPHRVRKCEGAETFGGDVAVLDQLVGLGQQWRMSIISKCPISELNVKAGLPCRNPVDDTFAYHDHRCMSAA